MNKDQKSMLFNFKAFDSKQDWRIINDGVMGGISQSEIISSKAGSLIFTGNVSLENSGGFASTRTAMPSIKVHTYKGIILRVKGDGKTYQIRLRTDRSFDGISYRYIFFTQPNIWIDVYAPFKNFKPTFRGRILNDAEPLATDRIKQIGFLIADKQSGPFRIEIEWIKTYMMAK